jgi:DHA1 family tetracycline resistance protein-like MFS transporter
VGLVLPFLVLTPVARGLERGAVGAVFAVHSAVLIAFEIPSGALADTIGRRPVLLVGAALTATSLGTFAIAQSVPAFMASVAALAAGRAHRGGLRIRDERRGAPVAAAARGPDGKR